ncbi:MAG: HAD family hydrolase [Candidatus Heimdallarchaeota archaeon]
MIEAVLLDLDNTLLHLDEKEFISNYLRLLSASFSDVLSPKDFTNDFLRATSAMVRNCSSKTNLEAFFDDFNEFVPTLSKDEVLSRFTSFYSNEYTQLAGLCTPNPFTKDIIEKLVAMTSTKKVLATNPLFPRSAVLERISWAEIDTGIFDLITHCENMHCSKPRKEYFLEICEKIAVKPNSCLMVGNDMTNDIAAGRIGMITYLVIDNQTPYFAPIKSLQKEMSQDEIVALPDFCGSLKDLLLLFNLASGCSDQLEERSHK